MKTLSLLFFCFTFAFINAQEVVIEWQNTIGGSDDDYYRSSARTPDGGFIIGGYSESNASSDKTEDSFGEGDFWILKITVDGEVEWDKTIGAEEDDFLKTLHVTSDSGYLLGGYTESGISGYKSEESISETNDYWIVKLNAAGDFLWDKTIGGTKSDILTEAEETPDGGYILGGSSKSGISAYKTENCRGDHDYWVVKLDADRNVMWDRTVGGDGLDVMQELTLTPDGGYLLSGYSASDASGDKSEDNHGDSLDYWLVKLNAEGEIMWDRTYGGDKAEYLFATRVTTDGGFIIAGSSNSEASGDKSDDIVGPWNYVDMWILKLDSEGNIEWDKTIGGNKDDGAKTIEQTMDGGFLVGGYSSSNISGNKSEEGFGASVDFWLVKLDNNGNFLWDRTYGGTDYDALRKIIEVDPGEYYIAGTSYSEISGNKTEANLGGPEDYWILTVKDSCVILPWYADVDGDGFGSGSAEFNSCFTPTGYVNDSSDCDDGNAMINTTMPETCNSIDDNCNGSADEGLPLNIFYADSDMDGYGNADADTASCYSLITGYLSDSTDCNDTNALIYPGAAEIQDSIDNNCNGLIDEGFTFITEEQVSAYIFPILVRNNIQVRITGDEGRCIFMLNDITGKNIMQQQLYSVLTEIDLSLLAAGSYIYSIQNGYGLVKSGKLIKLSL